MDYTVNLKEILSVKQLGCLQSLSARIRTLMSPELYKHSIGTLNCCIRMAGRLLLANTNGRLEEHTSGSSANYTRGSSGNLDKKTIANKCFNLIIAAILHDYGKIFSYVELKAAAVREKLKINDFELGCEPLLHSFMGPYLLKRDFKITNREVLNSVKVHTTGSIKMSLADKILYIADKIEETRDYEGVEKLRNLSYGDINLCLLEVYKSNIIYVIKGNNVLHPDTARIWNYMHGGLKNAIR